MMMTQRSLAAIDRSPRATLLIAACGMALVLFLSAMAVPLPVLAAGTRLHHAPAQSDRISAGKASTAGRFATGRLVADKRGGKTSRTLASTPESKHSRRAAASSAPKTSKAGIGAKSAKSSKETREPQTAHAKAHGRGQGQREPEMVDDPILMRRAGIHGSLRPTPPARQYIAKQYTDKPYIARRQTAKQQFAEQQMVKQEVIEQPNADLPPVDPGPVGVGQRSARERREVHQGMEPAAPAEKSAITDTNALHSAVSAPAAADAAPEFADAPEGARASSQNVQGFGAEVDVLTPRTGAHVPQSQQAFASPGDPETMLSPEDKRELTEEAVKPMTVPLYTRGGRLMVPAPLKGTHDILVHQNQMADNAGLSRIQDDADLNRMRAQHLLVSFPENDTLEVNEELPANRRYARPWTVRFVTDTARAYYARFGQPLRLNSAVRTVDYQLRLQRVNGNAAAVDGDGASPHLTGQAIDLGKRGMSMAELAWMRTYLLPLMQAGKIDVEEEFQQACFHISVYAGYLPARKAAPKTEVAQLRER